MQLVNPSWTIWEQEPGLEGIYKQIERAARVCYRSEGNIKEGSAKKMVDALIKNQHTAMLEHGTVYLKIEDRVDEMGRVHYPVIKGCYNYNPYCKVVHHHYEQKPDKFQKEFCESIPRTTEYITTSLRVLIENDWLEDLKFLCEPTEYHEKRVTVKFTADIHFYKDTTRHRVFSWAIESTRWCNYLKERFGMSVSFMKPSWIKEEDVPELEEDCKTIESIYFKWINKGYQAQHAAYFLIQGTKAEVVMTGYVSDFKHFFDLRADGTTGQPHPDVKALIQPLKEEFIKRNWI